MNSTLYPELGKKNRNILEGKPRAASVKCDRFAAAWNPSLKFRGSVKLSCSTFLGVGPQT